MMMMMMISILLLTLLNLTSLMPATTAQLPPSGVLLVSAATTTTADASPAAAQLPLSAPSEPFIKKMRFQVPESARLGNTMKLSCIYELSGASLHAMKLFKDDKEFYRYTPAVQQQQQQPNGLPTGPASDEQRIAFASPGIKVDLGRSNEQDIWIKILDKRAAGSYKCQVSIEDTFKSISAEKRMDVIERTRAGSTSQPPGGWLGQATSSSSSSAAAPHQQQRHAVQQQRNRAQASFMQQQQPAGGSSSSGSNNSLLGSKDSPGAKMSALTILCTILMIIMVVRRQQQQQPRRQETHPACADGDTSLGQTGPGCTKSRRRPRSSLWPKIRPRQFLHPMRIDDDDDDEDD